jgi:2-oxoglutarate ferredoxin oxidoreductase subunit alpha
MPAFGDGADLLVTGSTHDEWGFRKTEDPEVQRRLVTRLSRKILDHRAEICSVETYCMEDAQVMVVAYGFTARSALHAVRHLRGEGLEVGMMRLRTLWPFPEEAVARMGEGRARVLVPEMNLGQIQGEVQKAVDCPVEAYHQVNGEVIPPSVLLKWIRERSL